MHTPQLVSATKQVVYVPELKYQSSIFPFPLFRSEVVRNSKANQLRVSQAYNEFQFYSVKRPNLEECSVPMQYLKTNFVHFISDKRFHFKQQQEVRNYLETTTDTAMHHRKQEIARRFRDRESRLKEIQDLYAKEKRQQTKPEAEKSITQKAKPLGYESLPYWIILESAVTFILVLLCILHDRIPYFT